VKADFLRGYAENGPLPKHQELKRRHPDALEEAPFSMLDVVDHRHKQDTLVVSHRWLLKEVSDPNGVQLGEIRKLLAEPRYRHVRRVWFDEWCMPQGNKTTDELEAFDKMLTNVNLLYLGATVLIILDLSYSGRFWTQFEAWLSMQMVTPEGLKPAKGTKHERFVIRCIMGASSQYSNALVQQWATKTPEQAQLVLAGDDVVVTNQSDKWGQLPKVMQLDGVVQATFLRSGYAQGGAAFVSRKSRLPERPSSMTGVKLPTRKPSRRIALLITALALIGLVVGLVLAVGSSEPVASSPPEPLSPPSPLSPPPMVEPAASPPLFPSPLSSLPAAPVVALGSSEPAASPPLFPQPSSPPAMLQGLMALYLATDGANWAGGPYAGGNQNWLVGDPCTNNWAGVACSDGVLNNIQLWANNLVGTLPTELGLLTELVGINFVSNRLSGTIPTELSQVTRLEWLMLNNNYLSGTLPTELGQLSVGICSLTATQCCSRVYPISGWRPTNCPVAGSYCPTDSSTNAFACPVSTFLTNNCTVDLGLTC
jgi:hypothetical protein